MHYSTKFMKKISASIVVYKSEVKVLSKTIKCCLDSVGVDLKLYIIDNSPTDEVRNLCRNDDRIEYIFNNDNVGFGKAHNIALKKVQDRYKYHFVINPDVYFDSSVIIKMIKYMEENDQIGLMAPKAYYPNGDLQYLCKLLPTPKNLILRRFFNFREKSLQKNNYYYEMRFTDYNSPINAPFLSGCFMLLRTQALNTVGYFDENLFLYSEDTDLSRRFHRYYKTIFYPNVSIYHVHARGSYKSLLLLWHNMRSAFKYFNKYGWFNDIERDLINNHCISNSQTSIDKITAS